MFYDMNHQEDHFRLATDIHNSLFFAKLVCSVVLSAPSTFFFLYENHQNIEHDPEVDPGIRSHLIGFRKYGEDRKGKERKETMKCRRSTN